MKIIIVGNSPQLLEHKNGKLIDEFDVVIRTGRFVIDGYEKYTGTRTSIWSNRWCKMIESSSIILTLSLINQIWFSELDQHYFEDEITEYFNQHNKNIDVKFFSKHLLPEELYEYQPTLGYMCVLMAAKLFPDSQIFITGFGLNIDLNEFSGTYWDQQYTRRVKEGNHSFMRESIIMRKMIARGYIQLL